MPASLRPQSLPPGSPIIASYLGGSTVVTCMRAGLYQTKNGLPVFLGSLRSRKSMTLAEISSSTVFEVQPAQLRESSPEPSLLQRDAAVLCTVLFRPKKSRSYSCFPPLTKGPKLLPRRCDKAVTTELWQGIWDLRRSCRSYCPY